MHTFSNAGMAPVTWAQLSSVDKTEVAFGVATTNPNITEVQNTIGSASSLCSSGWFMFEVKGDPVLRTAHASC